MPTENDQHEIEVPAVKKGTVEFMTKQAFKNPTPETYSRLQKAANYFCTASIGIVSATDLFSGRQAKIINFILAMSIILFEALGYAVGVVSPDQRKNNSNDT